MQARLSHLQEVVLEAVLMDWDLMHHSIIPLALNLIQQISVCMFVTKAVTKFERSHLKVLGKGMFGKLFTISFF
jgi:hypothetical protein